MFGFFQEGSRLVSIQANVINLSLEHKMSKNVEKEREEAEIYAENKNRQNMSK